MENFTPIIQRKAITMDYEEYLKLEKRANSLGIVVADIMSAESLGDLGDLKSKYLKIVDEIRTGEF